MPSSRPRGVPSRPITLLCAAAALALAGCAQSGGGGRSADSVRSLSDLPNKSDSMLKVGDASRAAGDCPAAMRFYKMVTDKGGKPGDLAAAKMGTAECELSMNALPEARRDYLAAAKAAPNDPDPMIGLGRVLLVQHLPGEAVGYFDLALKKGATAPFVYNDKGVALDQLRRHKEAQAAYRTGLANYPTDRALRNNLALSLAMSREFKEAETMLRTLAAGPAATDRTRQNLALVLGLEGDVAGARSVSGGDLDGAALDNNRRFYDYARALITGAPLPTPAAELSSDDRAPVRTARAELEPMPPPVLVKGPLHGFRTAEPEKFLAPTIARTDLAAPAPTAGASQAVAAAMPATINPRALVTPQVAAASEPLAAQAPRPVAASSTPAAVASSEKSN
ncbi:MAG TPA: tetratricopeptide repeat protein [Stellaceae bacterium]